MEETANVTRLGNLVGGKDVSPLQATLNRHGDQIDKLGALIGQLSERLLSVRNMVPTENARADQTEPAASPIVGQVMRQTEMVLNLQSRVQELLNDLEV